MEQAYGRGSAVEGGTRPDTDTGLEAPLWHLALGGGSGSRGEPVYPERPGERDCDYYMRTGSCGYGDRCRYNHPRNRAGVAAAVWSGGEYPERVGQPVCQFFLKTGTCKFGATCKYHHPRQGGSVRPVQLNSYGYPLRLGEKDCAYYMKTGHCKFGATCKFHHPQPAGTSVPAPAPFFPAVQSPPVHSPSQFPAVASWQVSRPPQLMPGSYVQGAYGPVILSPGVVPVSGWSPYPSPVNPVMSPGSQPAFQAGSLYGLSHQLPPSAPAYPGPYQPISSSARPSSSSQREHRFPDRPGQPECQYYMRTGDCRFGSTCKYHHPTDRSMPKANYSLNQLGLPLRPGAPRCSFYMQYGECKFGSLCKFDHPMGTLGYSPSASSLADMPVAPFPIGLSVAALAPSSSSTDLRHEYLAGTSSRDSFASRMPSSGNTSSSSIGSIFSKGGTVSHSFVQAPVQSSTLRSSSSISHSGEVTSSG
uniref:Zinc finger CCCH domain-containing protein 6 n=1 Tax=Anthurium amnicola TaxID=1678845 RepID=A0A1D1Y113_9ARAE